jgi:hypothetical protein
MGEEENENENEATGLDQRKLKELIEGGECILIRKNKFFFFIMEYFMM